MQRGQPPRCPYKSRGLERTCARRQAAQAEACRHQPAGQRSIPPHSFISILLLVRHASVLAVAGPRQCTGALAAAGGRGGGGGHPQSWGPRCLPGLLLRSRGSGKRSEGGRHRCGAVCCDAQQQGHVACELEVTNPNQPPQFRTSPSPQAHLAALPPSPSTCPPYPSSCKHGGAFRLLLVFLSLRTGDGDCGREGRAPGSPRPAGTFREAASPALPGSWRSALLHVDGYCV